MYDDAAREVAKLFAKMYIARPKIKARQLSNGEWRPDETPFGMSDLLAHLAGEVSLGHYMVNEKNECKLFAFDIDLQKANVERGIQWPVPGGVEDDHWVNWSQGDPRLQWETKAGELEWVNDFYSYQMVGCAKVLANAITDVLDIPVAVAYSGHKGIHVYGFTGMIPAEEAREAASIAMEATNKFETWRGNNFFVGKTSASDYFTGWPQLSVEIFPKQGQLSGGGFGNLMRLPLGRNMLKSPFNPHEAKFIDLRYTQGKWGMVERNPIEALTIDNQWAGAV